MNEEKDAVLMSEIEVNKIEDKKPKKKQIKNKQAKDFWDYVIIQTSIACGILLIILAVNYFSNADLSKITSIISKFTF